MTYLKRGKDKKKSVAHPDPTTGANAGKRPIFNRGREKKNQVKYFPRRGRKAGGATLVYERGSHRKEENQ